MIPGLDPLNADYAKKRRTYLWKSAKARMVFISWGCATLFFGLVVALSFIGGLRTVIWDGPAGFREGIRILIFGVIFGVIAFISYNFASSSLQFVASIKRVPPIREQIAAQPNSRQSPPSSSPSMEPEVSHVRPASHDLIGDADKLLRPLQDESPSG